MYVKRKCPVCGKESERKITTEQYTEYEKYTIFGGDIREYMSDTDYSLQDFLDTGICKECSIKHTHN